MTINDYYLKKIPKNVVIWFCILFYPFSILICEYIINKLSVTSGHMNIADEVQPVLAESCTQ